MQQKNIDTAGFPEFNGFHLPTLEKEILAFWEQENIFQQSIDTRSAEKAFIFYEGPPSANGKPGIHHVMSRTIKDLFCRFKTLQGYQVHRKAGWDTHGLPVELNVEKNLGITKKDIGTKITVADYNQHCREDVLRYTDLWNDLTRQMGYWVDLENPYITYEKEYIQTLWSILKVLYAKNLLYKGFTIQPYSPAAGTGLSSHELNQPGCYKDVKDITAVVQFKVKKDEKSAFLFAEENEEVSILAWTTTPWTLPSNVALAVGSGIEYVKVKTFNAYTGNPITVILAQNLVSKFFTEENASLKLVDYKLGDKQIPFEILHSFKGSQLEHISYEPLLPYAKGAANRIIIGDFVTTSDGTGVVHISPSHGADDKRVADANGIEGVLLVDRQGRFTEDVFDFAGEYVKEAYYTDEEKKAEISKQGRENYLSVDIRIVDKLKKEGKLFKSEKYEHSYPHCWRTDKPVIYYPLDSWFVRTTAIKDRLIALNKTINWKPASTGEGRFGQWLENLVDWNLSRSRYWGTPLPIWRTDEGAEEICIGSMDELKSEIEKANASGLLPVQNTDVADLHKPFVDEIKLVSASGKIMKREEDLIDVWFDSGAMPYAQQHFVFDEKNMPASWAPADFIAEGVDQTRGWFFTLHVLGVALFDSVAYKNVVSNGLLLDAKGQKMSKRLGNIVDPFETITKYGADATRWYMMRNSDPWENLKFDIKGLEETSRAHFGTLYNTYSFFALYANIDGWKNTAESAAAVRELDKWILSKLHTLIQDVTGFYNDYEPLKATRAIELFVDAHLSNWYVRLSRRVFWKGEMNAEKNAAYKTIHTCLSAVAQLMSPVTPFFAEWLYKSLNPAGEFSSVHLSFLMETNVAQIDPDLEERMELAQKYSSMILSLRKKSLIKVRQPLAKVLIPILNSQEQAKIEKIESYILNEVNVKAIEYVNDTSGIIQKKAKPNFKTLGKKAGAKLKAVQDAIAAFSQENIQAIEKDGHFLLPIEGGSFEILREDIEIISEDIAGWLVTNDGALTVALDIHINDELRNEGLAREFVNKVQNLRKDKGFQVLDRISVEVSNHPALSKALVDFDGYIKNEILANSISMNPNLKEADEVEFNEETLLIKVNVVSNS